MKRKLKTMLKSGRIILLIVLLFIAVYAISPKPWANGIAIRSVALNSSASIAGIESPPPNSQPTSRERITELELNQKKYSINTVKDYYDLTENLLPDESFTIITNRNKYVLTILPVTETMILGELEEKQIPLTLETIEEINGTNRTIISFVTENITKIVNETFINQSNLEPYIVTKILTLEQNKTKSILVNKTLLNVIGKKDIGLSVYQAAKTNIRKGLDLQGGTRVILEPEKILSEDDMEILKLNMERRLNVYGLSDILIRVVRDKPIILGGVPKFILVEIPGANEQEVKDLLAQQGKFEAKIKNETVFLGGRDISYVCRTADCAGIDPQRGCGRLQDGWNCQFSFQISITTEAAERQSDATKNLAVEGTGQNRYLSEQIVFFLDDSEVDRLNIGASLKGRPVTDISISGGGIGRTQQEAIFDSLENMKSLQTILITGSLPVKLSIIKTDNISPVLGQQFINNMILVGFLALLAVAVVIFIRYRSLNISLPIVFILGSETILLLGLAAFVGWSLDLAAIAGIIIALGTGVDHLVVISDEVLDKSSERQGSWKDKLKKAFFIITAAYFTTLVAMIPLMFAGAGLLKGFAFTTMAGVTFGVFIARPAYAKIIEILHQGH